MPATVVTDEFGHRFKDSVTVAVGWDAVHRNGSTLTDEDYREFYCTVPILVTFVGRRSSAMIISITGVIRIKSLLPLNR